MVLKYLLSYGTGIIAVFLVAIYLYFGRKHDHWKKKGVKHLKPLPIIGTMKEVVFGRKNFAVVSKEVYDEHRKEPFIGLYSFDEPALHLHDVNLIKAVLIKDFQYFCDRNFKANEKVDPLLARGLMALKGDRWRHSRNAITPSFTSGKMKMMYGVICDCGKQLAQTLEAEVKDEPMIAYELASRYTIEVVASCIFGLQSNTLSDERSEFREKLRLVFDLTPLQALKAIGTLICPKIMELAGIKSLNPIVEEYVIHTIKETVKYRKDKNVKRHDLLQSLIEIMEDGEVEGESDKSQGDGKHRITMNELDVTGHSFTFLTAGFETSATTMSYALYELAKNEDIQVKLGEEIDTAMMENDGFIPYEALQSMKYLDMVVLETLRKYPPVGFLDRINNRAYRLPGTDLTLEAGTVILLPILGIHRDPEFYPNPMRFDPQRFAEENKANRPACTFLSFGEGPRACVGLRFALIQTKIGLAHILTSFSVHVADVTPTEVEFSARTFLSQPKSHVPLIFRRRELTTREHASETDHTVTSMQSTH